MPNKPELPNSFLQHTPWEADKNPIWLTSCLILLRNLGRYKFPSKLSESQAKSVFSSLWPIFEKSPQLHKPLLFAAEELSALDKEFLFEHFLCLDSFQNTVAGQGFIVDDSGEFLALVNLKNHLQLLLMDTSSNITEAWTKLSKIESEITQKIDLAFSPKFGYLTSDPTECGTGLIAIFYLHLPALNHAQQLQNILKEEEVVATSLEGSLDEIVGDIVLLRNRSTLGLSEENILHSLQSATFKLMAAEKSLRTHFQKENSAALKDQVSRAYGLLTTAYQLQTKEALNTLSLLKLGLDLGWVSGISPSKINAIFFQCRRGHLAHFLNEKTIDPQDIARKRAEFIHSQLQGITLN